MTFNEAVEEMKVLAGERPWALTYEATSWWDGKAKIVAYIQDRPHIGTQSEASITYREAIDSLKVKLFPESPVSPDEMPPDDKPNQQVDDATITEGMS
jgi:hypothetical protein